MSSSLDRCLTIRTYRVVTRSAVLLATLSLGACAQMGDISPLASVGSEPKTEVAQDSMTDLQRATEFWGKEVQKNPTDGKAALSYARNLKALGRKPEALGVLAAAYAYNAGNQDYLSEYGRLALDLGQVATAAQLLERADNPAKPDWRVLSARGTVLAKQGKYQDSIAYFERARSIAPSQPSVLNNLAMAYTMNGQADQAEGLLREASAMSGASEKVKRNLAMVLELQGKEREARQMVDGSQGGAIAPSPVAANAPAAGLVHKAVAKGSEAVATAPVLPVSSAPLDPDAIIAAAMQAEADKAKSEQPASKASSSKPKPKRYQKPKFAETSAQEPMLKPTTR